MKKWVLGILIAVAAVVFATAAGLGFIQITDIPYTSDIEALNIEMVSGLGREEIMANYHAVMDYLSPFSREDFSLPTLAFSDSGGYHFYECKVIFGRLYALGALCAAVLAIAAIKLERRRIPIETLAVSGALTLALPAVLLGVIAVDFNRAFVLFHKLFFNNDMWIFDCRIDPIITILPEEFFLHCALIIAGAIALTSAVQLAVYFVSRGRRAL
ncbi:MAG: TIGR01906 family membrane protein [Oscillospiraceae bacterium]